MSSYVLLALDTRAPVLTITAPVSVEGTDWMVTIVSSEVIGGAEFVFTDPVGNEYPVGYVQDGNEILLAIPSGGIAGGVGVLTGWVADDVGNRALVYREVTLLRPSGYSVVVTIDHAFGTVGVLDHAYEVGGTIGVAHAVESTVDHAYEVVIEMEAG